MRNQWQNTVDEREGEREEEKIVRIHQTRLTREYRSAHGKAINSSDIDVPFFVSRKIPHLLTESSIVKKMQRRENGINLNTLSCTNVILVFIFASFKFEDVLL